MKKKSMFLHFYLISLAGTTIAIIIAGSLWIYSEVKNFEQDADRQRMVYLEGIKALLKDQIRTVVSNIEYMKSIAAQRLKEDIKGRVDQAYHFIQAY